jgi:CelD/BcsL family acetyltransferase involved in cellulose biosynthesis
VPTKSPRSAPTRVPRDIEFTYEALPPLEILEREWRTLEVLARPSFFTSWQWVGTLLAAVPPMYQPKLLRGTVRDETIGLALLGTSVTHRRRRLVRSRGLHLNETGDPRFDSITIEHNGILAPAGQEAVMFDSAVAWFAALGEKADEFYINGSGLRLSEATVEGRGLSRRETTLPCYSLDLGLLSSSGGAPYPVLSTNARQQLRRALRHFEGCGPLELNAAATTTEALAFFAELKALHCASWERRGKRHAFSGEFFEPFHRLLIERNFAAGGTQLLRVSAGNRAIGYLYNFRMGDRIYAYQSGFADADRRERPGIVTHALAIQHAFRLGARVYDFMAGRNRLKETFSTRCEPMLWQVVQQPRLAFRLEQLLRRFKHAIIARKPLSAMRRRNGASRGLRPTCG